MSGASKRNCGSANTFVRLSQQTASAKLSSGSTGTGTSGSVLPEMLYRSLGWTGLLHVSNSAGGRPRCRRPAPAASPSLPTSAPLPLCSTEMDFTSRCALPRAPSAQISRRTIFASFAAVGHTSESWAQVAVCLPVAGLHLSLKARRGIRTEEKSSPAGTEKLALKQPRLRGMDPPPAQAYAADRVPEAKETRKPSYSGVVERTSRTRSPSAALDASGKLPSAAALMNPGALRLGTSTTSPSNTPACAVAFRVQVPVERPPMTGSLSSTNLKVVAGVPSKVTRSTALTLRAAARSSGTADRAMAPATPPVCAAL
mmetsp:Transcript_60180/g.160892  ORF Transcript_60180/g.160892 Transcript_60180/m.160892 type:complete len:314 (+) Transcript_60180:435-1376(+)